MGAIRRCDWDPTRSPRLVRLGQPPALTAVSAVAIDLDSGQTLYVHEPAGSRPPASTVKVMTALVVLQHADIDDAVVVSAKAAATGGSRMGLTAGESLTVVDLLYGLLLPSGNDAAVALAEHVAGDEASFVALMNATAGTLGLSGTHFTNPHGLDDARAGGQCGRPGSDHQGGPGLPCVCANRCHTAGHDRRPAADQHQRAVRQLSRRRWDQDRHHGRGRRVLDRFDKSRRASLAGGRVGQPGPLCGCPCPVGLRGRRLVVAGAALPDNALAWEAGPEARLYRLRSSETFDIFLPAWQWPLVQPVRWIDASVPLTGTLPVGSLTWLLGNDVIATVPLVAVQGP